MRANFASFFFGVTYTAYHVSVKTLSHEMAAHAIKPFDFLRMTTFEETDKARRVTFAIVL